MGIIIGFILGSILGGITGVFILALLQVNKEDNNDL